MALAKSLYGDAKIMWFKKYAGTQNAFRVMLWLDDERPRVGLWFWAV